MELELSLKPTKIGEKIGDDAPQSYKDYMEIREQYNSFVEGRINQMIKVLDASKTPAKATKLHQDVIQTLKVNLEAQYEKIEEERKLQDSSYQKVRNFL